jgi:hypothetical protein
LAHSQDRAKREEGEVIASKLILVSCHPTALLGLVEEPFNQVPTQQSYGLKQIGSLRLHLCGTSASAPFLTAKAPVQSASLPRSASSIDF